MRHYGRGPLEPFGMQHLNGNLLCAVDVETTGLDPQKHDIIQLCILPLDAGIRPLQNVRPFVIEMTPKRPENIQLGATKTHRIDMAALILRAVDPWKAVDLFEEWFERLNLPLGKKIMPLAHNWVFDRSFIMEWIGGPISYDHHFHFHYRDSMALALALNDRANQKMEKPPYPKVSLSYCGSMTDVANLKAHDALSDCVATAEIYRRMLLQAM